MLLVKLSINWPFVEFTDAEDNPNNAPMMIYYIINYIYQKKLMIKRKY